jgi:hypothetical protein
MAKVRFISDGIQEHHYWRSTPQGSFVKTSAGNVYLRGQVGWINLETGGETAASQDSYISGALLTKGSRFEVTV